MIGYSIVTDGAAAVWPEVNMGARLPYILFGGTESKRGGMADYRGSYSSTDEAEEAARKEHLTWAEFVAANDEGLSVYARWPDEAPRRKPKEKLETLSE